MIANVSLFAALLALSPQAQKGREVMERMQCTRCHDVTDIGDRGRGLQPADRAVHCVDCHTWILATRYDEARKAEMRLEYPDWDRYLENVVHFTRLPDLGTLTRRVRPAFVRRFLDAPFDLRPHLDESMLPLQLEPAEKDAVVAYLTALNGHAVATDTAPPPKPTAARIAEGRDLFVRGACPSCHIRGTLRAQPNLDRAFYRSMHSANALAPNLRFVRDRIPRAVLGRYIANPPAVDPKIAMPALGVPPADAERIADFLYFAPIDYDDPLPVVVPEAFPLLDRPVAYDEVYDEVLGRICIHCHMNPESNNGDGGSGNTGGLGWKGSKLDLETYEGLMRGLEREEKRISVVEPQKPGEEPLLLGALLRRWQEGRRDHRPPYADAPDATDAPSPDPKALGMPLGLPPLTAHQIRLVKTWLHQGAKGPALDGL